MPSKLAYLTIDDAPIKDLKKRIDFLKRHNIQAIWFCIGQNLEKYPEQAAYAIKNNQILGNHSYSHKHFSQLSIDKAYNEIKKADDLINKIYKNIKVKRKLRVFRFPYLDNGDNAEYLKTNWKDTHVQEIQQILRELGYKQPQFKHINYRWYKEAGFDKCLNVDCTYDTFDWCLEEGVSMYSYKDLPSVLKRIDENKPEHGRGLNFPDSNEIIMMHSWITFQEFKTIINKILSKNVEFASIV